MKMREGVVGVVLVAEAGAVALGVVVGDHRAGLAGGHVAPALAEVLEVGELLAVEHPLEVGGVAEFLDVAAAEVLAGGDRFARAVDGFLDPVDVGVAELAADG
ncbi:hypothetical protein [Streptomyces roseolilacinus]